MADINNFITPEISKGIEFLYQYLGEDGKSLLREVPSKNGEIICFEFPLPEDYLGIERTLCLGFDKGFPNTGLKLQIQPSAWLEWPHVMQKSLCLYGFGNQPVGNSPEFVIRDTFRRLSKLINLVLPDSDKDIRKNEFFREITPYWRMQLARNRQQLILLQQPTNTCELFVLTDQRQNFKNNKIIWVAEDVLTLENHLFRLFNRIPKISEPANAGFFIRLKTCPDVKVPSQDNIISWLSEHISKEDELLFSKWNLKSSRYPIRWLLLQVPNTNPPIIQSIILRHKGVKDNSYQIYGKRAARRWEIPKTLSPLTSLEYCPVHLISKSTIHSRDTILINEDLGNKKVAIIGIGSLGSSVAVQLARAGVSNLMLIDPDKFESANIGRHVLGMDDLGHYKTDALKERIQKDIPFSNIKSIPGFIQYELIDQISLLDDVDAVVITSANWLSEELLWFFRGLCRKKWIFIQGWTEPHAIIGHILVSPLNSDIDGRYMFDHNGNFKYSFTSWSDKGLIPLPGCGDGFIPGGLIGISSIANLMAQTTIDTLTGKINKETWISSIGDIEKIIDTNGIYNGPNIPSGCKQMVISRDWPLMEDFNES